MCRNNYNPSELSIRNVCRRIVALPATVNHILMPFVLKGPLVRCSFTHHAAGLHLSFYRLCWTCHYQLRVEGKLCSSSVCNLPQAYDANNLSVFLPWDSLHVLFYHVEGQSFVVYVEDWSSNWLEQVAAPHCSFVSPSLPAVIDSQAKIQSKPGPRIWCHLSNLTYPVAKEEHTGLLMPTYL